MAEDSRPELLYLSPVVPLVTGNGLAMRAGTVLEALAERYSISLLVIALYAPYLPRVPEPFAGLCKRTAVIPPPRPGWRSVLSLARWTGPFADYAKRRFDVVHVFRLAMVPYAKIFLQRGAPAHLDLDDLESLTHRRIAALCRANGDMGLALYEEQQARQAEPAEAEAFKLFHRIYVCSEQDRAKLSGRTRAALCVLPNAVRVPDAAPPRHDLAFKFLFVGTLGYYPNDDGARYFCTEILPHIHNQSPGEFRIEIAGLGASARLVEASRQAGARLSGWVPDLAAAYADAGAVVVPVRAGGGTRIKVLEAFAYRRPVITTSIGIEGIEARHQEHVLIADTPADFARECVRLMHDPDLRERLTTNARALLDQRYTIAALRRTIASTLSLPARKESQSGAASPSPT